MISICNHFQQDIRGGETTFLTLTINHRLLTSFKIKNVKSSVIFVSSAMRS